MKKSNYYMGLEEEYSAHNYSPLPIVITRSKGVWVWDPEGKKYIDMLSAYSSLNQGHRHPKIIKALKEQAGRVTITARAFYNDQLGPLSEYLTKSFGYDKFLPMNTGAEAIETALKVARKWGYKRKNVRPNKAEIIACKNNFHGRTISIITMSSVKQFRDGFGPFTPGFKLIPFNDIKALKKAITKNTVAFLVEPIQAEGGIMLPDPGYLRACAEICRQHNVLFMLDEIQTGLGRTGKLFAYMHDTEQAKPDVLIIGKALSGGVSPVSGILCDNEIMNVLTPGDHGSTFGGNPLGCAVAKASVEVIIKEKLSERAEKQGKYFMDELRKIKSPYIKQVRGQGLLIGIELKKSAGKAKEFCKKMLKQGVMCYPSTSHSEVIRFAPPLIIKRLELKWALKRIRKVLEN